MKRATFIGVPICALLALGLWAAALPLAENVEAKKPERGLGRLNERTSPSDMLRDIRRIYLTPICEEWPYIDGNGDALAPGTCSNISVRKDTPLSEALDAVVARSGGMYRWERNHGSICVVGTGKGRNPENCLDTWIDLHVEKLSTWDALCAVAKAVNEKPVNGRRMGVYPGFVELRRYATPKGLKDNPCITLDLRDVPARDAVCAIIAQAPLKMDCAYFNSQGMGDAPPVATLTIYILGDDGLGYCGSEDLPTREYLSYRADYFEMIGDVVQAAKCRRSAEKGDQYDAEMKEFRERQAAKRKAEFEKQGAEEMTLEEGIEKLRKQAE